MADGRLRLYLQESIYEEELHEEVSVSGTLVHVQESSPGCCRLETHSDVVDGGQFHGRKLQIGISKVPDVAGTSEDREEMRQMKTARLQVMQLRRKLC